MDVKVLCKESVISVRIFNAKTYLGLGMIFEEPLAYTNHDLLFKQLFRHFFKDFLKAFFPKIYDQIDVKSATLLSGEVFTDIVKGKTRKLDIVIRATVKNKKSLIIVHVEPQSSQQSNFNERMFSYYSLLYHEYRLPIIPIAVFTYDSPWEKDSFSIQALDTTYLHFRYHTLHLKKMNWRAFIRNDNPVVAALLSKMGYTVEERILVKIEFMRMLWRLQLDEAEQRLIYGFFETYLTLTDEEENTFMETVKQFDDAEEIFKIPISYEEKGIKKGMEQGVKEGFFKAKKDVAIKMLKEGLPLELIMKITNLNNETLEELKKQL